LAVLAIEGVGIREKRKEKREKSKKFAILNFFLSSFFIFLLNLLTYITV